MSNKQGLGQWNYGKRCLRNSWERRFCLWIRGNVFDEYGFKISAWLLSKVSVISIIIIKINSSTLYKSVIIFPIHVLSLFWKDQSLYNILGVMSQSFFKILSKLSNLNLSFDLLINLKFNRYLPNSIWKA